MPTASWPITARVAVAAFVGIVASVLAIGVLFWLMSPRGTGPSDGIRAGAVALFVLRAFAGTMILIPLALIIAGPVVLMAIIAGAVLKPWIERHLFLWSAASPFAVWLSVCVFEALTRRTPYFQTHGLIDRLSVTVGSKDNLLFLFGPLVSGLIFYGLSVSRKQTPPA